MNPFQSFTQQVIPVPHVNGMINYKACKKCAECGPVCCQRLPCSISPEEVKDLSLQGIRNLIETGLVSIDWWMGRIEDDGTLDVETAQSAAQLLGIEDEEELVEEMQYKSFFLRMRGKDDPICHPAILPSVCAAWSPIDGCQFPFSYRPKGGRMLLPPNCELNQTDKCKETYTKRRCAYDWSPYRGILEQVYHEYKDWWTDSPYDSLMMELSKMVYGSQEQKDLIDLYLN